MASTKVISPGKQTVEAEKDSIDVPIRNCGHEVWATDHFLAKSLPNLFTADISVVSLETGLSDDSCSMLCF